MADDQATESGAAEGAPNSSNGTLLGWALFGGLAAAGWWITGEIILPVLGLDHVRLPLFVFALIGLVSIGVVAAGLGLIGLVIYRLWRAMRGEVVLAPASTGRWTTPRPMADRPSTSGLAPIRWVVATRADGIALCRHPNLGTAFETWPQGTTFEVLGPTQPPWQFVRAPDGQTGWIPRKRVVPANQS